MGRPPKLATEIAALLIAGSTTTEVAQMVGVSRRSIVGWRARAWSRDARDQHCVALERMVMRGKLAAAEIDQRSPHEPQWSTLPSLAELLADFAD